MSDAARSTIIGVAILAALGSSCKSAETKPVPSPAASVPSSATGIDPVNDVSAQGSVHSAIAASKKVFVKDGSYKNLTAASMSAVVPNLRFDIPSTSYLEVNFQVRGDSSLALAAMSPSGACFGALGHGGDFAYSHSGAGQTVCDATDVPYSESGWNTRVQGL